MEAAEAAGEGIPTSGSAGASTRPIHDIRAFNRFYTNLIGALDYSRQLYVPYTLTEARVLYELAHSPRTDAADLRGALSLDAGYLSRLLAKFEKAELVERAPSSRDPRRQSITLTGHGRSAADLLDERSRESVGALLGRVPAGDRSRLTGAMRTIQDILSRDRSPHRDDVVLRAPGPGDLGWIIQRNAAVYAAEFGWNSDYEALVARIVADFAEHHDPRLERVWVAELDDRPVGCVMCVRDTHGDANHGEASHGDATAGEGTAPAEDTALADTASGEDASGDGAASGETTASVRDAGPEQGPRPSPGTARLRLLLVEPDARGLGIGDRLVRACTEFAREAGYDDMVLWTNDVLRSARGIYQRHGFTLTAEQPHHSFGADLTGQDWHLRLRTAEDSAIPPGRTASREGGAAAEAPAPEEAGVRISGREGAASGRRG
ncbi:hypothetical protein Sm713_29850 [Streptomyces sp. TS71-3]|nr:hypothetical protein Sm713_29850 [Streptomyces sp. TS71-3]